MADSAKPDTKKGLACWYWSRRGVVRIVQWSSICNGFCLALCAVCSFLLTSGSLSVSFSSVTLSGYIVFLGLLMCVIELNIGLLQRKLRRSCGFMFSYAGRATYIFFVGTMAVALGFGGGGVWLMYTIGELPVTRTRTLALAPAQPAPCRIRPPQPGSPFSTRYSTLSSSLSTQPSGARTPLTTHGPPPPRPPPQPLLQPRLPLLARVARLPATKSSPSSPLAPSSLPRRRALWHTWPCSLGPSSPRTL